jgi:hypothetical protein
MTTRTLLAGLSLAVVVNCTGCRLPRLTPSPEIRLSFPGPVESLSGMDWPTDDRGLSEVTCRQEPCNLTVAFPSGRTFRTPTRLLFLEQREGIITNVDVLPMQELAPFPEAVGQVERFAEGLGVSGQRQVRRRLKEWRETRPESSVSTRGLIEEPVAVFFEIKPHPSGRGWFVTLTFEHLDPQDWKELAADDSEEAAAGDSGLEAAGNRPSRHGRGPLARHVGRGHAGGLEGVRNAGAAIPDWQSRPAAVLFAGQG